MTDQGNKKKCHLQVSDVERGQIPENIGDDNVC